MSFALTKLDRLPATSLVRINDSLVLDKKEYFEYFLKIPKVLVDLVCSFIGPEAEGSYNLNKIALSWPTLSLPLPVGDQSVRIYGVFKKNCPGPLIFTTATYKFYVAKAADFFEPKNETSYTGVYGDLEDIYDHSKWILLEKSSYRKTVVGEKMVQAQTHYSYMIKMQPE